MSDNPDGHNRENEKEAFSESVERHNEITGSGKISTTGDSERVEKSGEITDNRDVPEGGYVMAPTRSNPDRGSNSSSNDSESDS